MEGMGDMVMAGVVMATVMAEDTGMDGVVMVMVVDTGMAGAEDTEATVGEAMEAMEAGGTPIILTAMLIIGTTARADAR